MKLKEEKIHIRKAFAHENDFDSLLMCIENLLNNSHYDFIITQKLLWKLYSSQKYSTEQYKRIEKALIEKAFPNNSHFKNYLNFVIEFTPVAMKIYNYIRDIIVANFNDSLFLFIYCMGKYINYVKLEIILLPQNLLLSIASKCLTNDIKYGLIQAKLQFADSVFLSKIDVFEVIYQAALQYGCLSERFDNVSYLRSRVSKILVSNNKPNIELRIADPNLELGIEISNTYNKYLFERDKYEENLFIEGNSVYKYYKCKMCRSISLLYPDRADELKDVAFKLLNRQYSSLNMIDAIYFHTCPTSSIILSILTHLYIELIYLMLCIDDSYKILSKNELRKSMYLAEHITDSEFNFYLSLICSNQQLFNSAIPFFQNNDNIIIGNWMFNGDFLIPEEAKNICFGNTKYKQLGKESDYFGKQVFEKIVKDHLHRFGWQVVLRNINLKVNKKFVTDIDVLAYCNGIVIVGQIKYAHSGRTPYQLWKASEVIKKGIEQTNKCIHVLQQDNNLLYSILKNENIINNRHQITEIIPVIVTSSTHFTIFDSNSNIAIIGFEMLSELLYEANIMDNNSFRKAALTDPLAQYNYNRALTRVDSVIENNYYKITYEEYE